MLPHIILYMTDSLEKYYLWIFFCFQKWQLGLVFVPDSLGYFVGTNFFGEVSLRFGRWKMSMTSLAAIGISCFIVVQFL